MLFPASKATRLPWYTRHGSRRGRRRGDSDGSPLSHRIRAGMTRQQDQHLPPWVLALHVPRAAASGASLDAKPCGDAGKCRRTTKLTRYQDIRHPAKPRLPLRIRLCCISRREHNAPFPSGHKTGGYAARPAIRSPLWAVAFNLLLPPSTTGGICDRGIGSLWTLRIHPAVNSKIPRIPSATPLLSVVSTKE